MTTILSKEEINNEIKGAIYEVLHLSDKSVREISVQTGIGASHLTRSALKGPSGCNFQLEWIPLVTIASDNYAILDTLEHIVGRVGVPLPPPNGASTAGICRLTMRSITEFGELMKEVEQAIADDIIKPSERERIVEEGYEAVQAILALMEICKGE